MSAHDQYDELVAGYVLGILTPEERQTFEAHRSTCDVCRAAVPDLRRVSAAVGAGSDLVAPPARLRARTIAFATAQAQDASPEPRPAATPPAVEPTSRRAMPVPPRRGHSPSTWLLLAASWLTIVGVGAYAWGLRSDLLSTRGLLGDMSARIETLRSQLASARQDSARLTSTLSVLRAPDVVRVDLRSAPESDAPSARAFVSPRAGLVFNAAHLPRLAPNRTYQLWVVAVGVTDPISAGVFDVDASGNSAFTVPLPPGLGTIAAVAITEEPSGGSIKATTSPLLAGKVANN